MSQLPRSWLSPVIAIGLVVAIVVSSYLFSSWGPEPTETALYRDVADVAARMTEHRRKAGRLPLSVLDLTRVDPTSGDVVDRLKSRGSIQFDARAVNDPFMRYSFVLVQRRAFARRRMRVDVSARLGEAPRVETSLPGARDGR